MNNEKTSQNPITVALADHSTMQSYAEGDLPIPGLPPEALKAHEFEALGPTSLISIPQLCDAGCEANFVREKATIKHNNQDIMQGHRDNTTNGLWTLQLQHQETANSVTHKSTLTEDLVAYVHTSLFSPTVSTLKTALRKGYLPQFPGLTLETLTKYPPKSMATEKGHMDAQRQGTRSTKPPQEERNDIVKQILEDHFPESTGTGELSNTCYVAMHETRGQVHSDLTGRFPIPSSAGNQYILIVYDYDSNNIIMEPVNNRAAATLRQAMEKITAKLVTGGCRPRFHRLDNECSEEMKTFFRKTNVDFQLVPPHDHRRNAAERAVRTAKNHLIAGWCSMDKDFPMSQWHNTLEQAELTLNLLRGSRINPKLSAWEQIHGRYDFNRTPIAPPGVRVTAFEHPDQRKTWAPHAVDGWYTCFTMESYRCYKIYVKATRAIRICEKLAWFPEKIRMPEANQDEMIYAIFDDLRTLLTTTDPGNVISALHPSKQQLILEVLDIISNRSNMADRNPQASN